jgi:chromosomal replication initiator protein
MEGGGVTVPALYAEQPRAIAPDRLVFVSTIKTMVASYFGIAFAHMTGADRSREIARPRQIAMYLAFRHTPMSRCEIGRRFGGRDHTTVLHACRQIERLIIEDDELASAVARLSADILATALERPQ